MKKLRTDTGGYALIYVLIIVLVLCAVAVTICTAALENYQAQEESVRQTQQLYQAEGEIEKFVALAEKVSSLQYFGEYDSEDVAKAAAKAVYVEHLKNLVSVHPDGTDADVKYCTFALDPAETSDPDINFCKFTLTYKNDTVCIETKISMTLTYDVEPLPDETSETTYTARVSKASHNYSTYTITHLTAEGGAGG